MESGPGLFGEDDRTAWQRLTDIGAASAERSDRAFAAVVMLLAAVLRLFDLGSDPLWIDEYITWAMVNPGPGHGFWEQFRDNIQGPLYLAALWPLIRDNASEFLMRLPAALAGIATIPLMLRLGVELDDPRSGRWAALLLAVNPFHLWYCQEARGYAFLIFFSLAATILLVRMMIRGATYRRAVAYGLLAGLAVLSNMSALFLFVAQGLGVLLFARPWSNYRWRPWLTAFGIVGLISVPWLLEATGYWYVGRLAPDGAGGLQPAGNASLNVWAYPFSLFAFFYGFTLGPTLTELHQPDRLDLVKESLPVLAPAGLIVGVLLLAGLAKLRWWVRASMVVWIVGPVLILTALRLADIKTFTPRYLSALMPILVFMAAVGLRRLPARPAVVCGLTWLVLTVWSTGNYHLNHRYARDDVRAAAEWIQAREDTGDAVLVPVVTNVFAHYYQGTGEVKDFWDCPHVADAATARSLIAERVDGAAGAWLVLSRSESLDPGHHLEQAFLAIGSADASQAFPGVRLLHVTDLEESVSETSPPGKVITP
jgi:mannosyltransferase